MLNNIHIPVLFNELIAGLNIKPNGLYVDCTAGFGGHSSGIANKLSNGHLTCIDQDQNAISYLNKMFNGSKLVTICKNNFANIDQIISNKVDGIIVDLGVSSLMFDDPQRGFSYRFDGPLDMRMNQQDGLMAADIINTYSKEKLISIFKKYGEIPSPNKVVNEIAKQRDKTPITKTSQLVDIITKCHPGSWIRKHPAKVYFQALRIEVNKELDVLKQFLIKASNLLKPKGRLCIITFHSLEDRIVKNFFKEKTQTKDLYAKDIPLTKIQKPNFKLITKKPILPSQDEIVKNKRSHSAKLRIIEKV